MIPQTFRSTAAMVGGWVWMAFAALNLVDIAIRGRDLSSAVAAAVLLLGCGVAYAIGLRPRVTTGDSGVLVRNPLRDTVLPWASITSVDLADTLRIHYGDRKVRAWCLPSSPRARVRAERRAARDAAALPKDVAEKIKGRTPADFAHEQLTAALKERHDATGAEPATTWSLPAVLGIAAPGVVSAALILAALLT